MDYRDNLQIITTKEELKGLIREAVADLDLSIPRQVEESKLIHGLAGLAEFLNCDVTTAFKYKNTGRIPYYQIGRTLIFKSEEVLKAMAKKKK